MDEKTIELLERIATALEKKNGIPIWDIIINVIPWIGVLVTIFFLLRERQEKNRPYLQISFELVRSTMACLVIRNVGSVPAELKSMEFNKEFIEQLGKCKVQVLEKKKEMNVVIFPEKFWVLSLDRQIFDIMDFQNTELTIQYAYGEFKKKKRFFKEQRYYGETTIDFKEYGSFLLYLSEIDELKTITERNLKEITTLCDKMVQYMKKDRE